VNLADGAIVARPIPGRGEAMVPVLLSGHVLAVVLGLRGAAVLHASALELDGTAVAFCGPSGAGKSTAAALLCGAGARLVTDDAARVEEREGAVLVHRGPAELRLRPQAGGLAQAVEGTMRTTADGRVGVACPPAEQDTTPLGAVVFPRWPPETRSPRVTPLRAREAMHSFLRCPRIGGWRTLGPVRTHLDVCARIAEGVPAFAAELPKAGLSDDDFPRLLREAIAEAGAP